MVTGVILDLLFTNIKFNSIYQVCHVITICSNSCLITTSFVFADLNSVEALGQPSITVKVNRNFARTRHRPMGFKMEWKCPHLIFNLPVLLDDGWQLSQGTLSALTIDTMPLSLPISPNQSLAAARESNDWRPPGLVRLMTSRNHWINPSTVGNLARHSSSILPLPWAV